MVEFALVIPLFMLLLLMAVDFGRLFFSYVQINNAAREAAAYAATAPTDNTAILAKARLETNSQAQRGEGTVTDDDHLHQRRGNDHRLLGVVGRRRRRQPDQGRGQRAVHVPDPVHRRLLREPVHDQRIGQLHRPRLRGLDVRDAPAGNLRRAGPELHRHSDGPVGLRGPERLDPEQRDLQHLRLQLGLG